MSTVTDQSDRQLFRGRVPRDNAGRTCRFAIRPRGGAAVYAFALPEALEAVMGEGYAALPADGRREARRAHATDTASALQRSLAAHHASSVTNEVLGEPKDQPVSVSEWTGDVPLVLVDSWYRPRTGVFPPQGAVMWLRPEDEWLYAVSLADAGLVDVAARV